MHDLPRQKLGEIIVMYGRLVCEDPRRCEALLRDLCSQYHREITVLIGAQKERVAHDLLVSQHVPAPVLMAQLTQRLQDNLALTKDAATWAVESWALALGIISSADISSRSSAATATPVPTTGAPKPAARISPPPSPTTTPRPVARLGRSTPRRARVSIPLMGLIVIVLIAFMAGRFLSGVILQNVNGLAAPRITSVDDSQASASLAESSSSAPAVAEPAPGQPTDPPTSGATDSQTESSPEPAASPPADAASAAPEPATIAIAAPPILSRDAWGAQPATGMNGGHQPRQITISHDAKPIAATADPVQKLQRIQSVHQQQWVDLAWHYIIDQNGKIYEGHALHDRGNTSYHYDTEGIIAIGMLGDYDTQLPSAQQIDALVSLTAWLCQEFNISVEEMYPHSFFANQSPRTNPKITSPGQYLSVDDIRRQVAERLAGR